MHLEKRWIILSTVIALVAILVTAWWCMGQPSYETMLYGQIKLRRNDETPNSWFIYAFDIPQKTELILKIELPKESDMVSWKICNTTKETSLEAFSNGTAWDLVYRDGFTEQAFVKKVIEVDAGTYTFILMLAKWSRFETVVANLELSIKAA